MVLHTGRRLLDAWEERLRNWWSRREATARVGGQACCTEIAAVSFRATRSANSWRPPIALEQEHCEQLCADKGRHQKFLGGASNGSGRIDGSPRHGLSAVTLSSARPIPGSDELPHQEGRRFTQLSMKMEKNPTE